MSKLSKLIKTPNLYLKDAIEKRLNKKSINKKKAQSKHKEIVQMNVERYKIDIKKIKVNLVIIDNILEEYKIKNNILKLQYRSIEKYGNFSSVSYISKDIKSAHKEILTYENYDDFFQKRIFPNSHRNEVFVFININFFFLKKINHSDFIGANGEVITYIKKNKNKIINFDSDINNIIEGVSYNFTPMENISICNTISLIYLDKKNINKLSSNEYIFKFLPIVGTILLQNSMLESPIQYARLDYGFIEKFVWIQSVHGSSRCPLAITFDESTSNESLYFEFLESLFPHSSNREAALSAI